MLLWIFSQIFVIFLLGILAIYLMQLRRKFKLKEIPCPPLVPICGNLLQINCSPEEIWNSFTNFKNEYGKIFQMWVGPFRQFIMCSDPNLAQQIMNSSKHIDKLDDIYEFVADWIGYGLLISTGEKWHKRRKLLTSAFHFTILEQAVDIINSAGNILIEKLECHLNGNAFDIAPYLSLCTLDIICESAMGVKMHAQTETNSEYVCALRDILNASFHRIFNVLEHSRFIFKYFTRNGKIFYRSVKILHAVTRKVIKDRRAILLRKLSQPESQHLQNNGASRRQPKAFLDALLLSTIDGQPLADSDIQEEVDTFMFEGHDTVSSALCFSVYLLAKHPDIQEKAFQEQREIFGDNRNVQAKATDLTKMKYLELVIKETLRMYPSVFVIGRNLTEDLTYENVTFPKNTKCGILIHLMHNDKNYFPEPDVFKPERFLNESYKTENPFAYIPFSAGPRNCIGQKFAMYELKLILSKILRTYTLITNHTVKLSWAGILKSANGVFIQIKPRLYA